MKNNQDAIEQVQVDTSLQLPCGKTIKNRLVKAAMSEQMADKRSNPTAAMATLYKRWAKSGVGLILTGNIMLSKDARGEPGNVVLDQFSDKQAFSDWTQAVHSEGGTIFAQINHPGKQIPAFLNMKPMAPSAIPLGGPLAPAFMKPREMSEQDIESVIKQFVATSKLAKEVGFDGIQLHGAHGYLVNQFLSSRHNIREDSWGGSFENRFAFVRELYKQVREAVGNDFPIAIKLNSSDFEQDGYSEEDALKVMFELQQLGIDFIEISGGTYEVQAMVDGTGENSGGYFLNFATRAAKELNVPLAITGGFRSRKDVINALAKDIDMVGLARVMAIHPDFPSKILKGEDVEVSIPRLTTGSYKLDQFMMVVLSWYEVQMARMGNGLEPNPQMSVWRAVWYTMKQLGTDAFKPRRA